MGTQIPFPVNEVLILRSPRPHVQDFLHFSLHHPIDKVRWWFQEVFTMFFGLLIGVEQLGVEDIVYLPMSWQFEAEIYVSDCLKDFERPVSFWPQLLGGMCGVKICGFQPDPVPFTVRFVIGGFDPRFLCMLHGECCLLTNSLQGPLSLHQVRYLWILDHLMCSWRIPHPQLIEAFLVVLDGRLFIIYCTTGSHSVQSFA